MWVNINLTKIVLLFLAISAPLWLITIFLTSYYNDPTYEIKFDCRQAAIRIDYPIEVKEKCRKVMRKYEETTR